jgi:hypothetical protein
VPETASRLIFGKAKYTWVLSIISSTGADAGAPAHQKKRLCPTHLHLPLHLRSLNSMTTSFNGRKKRVLLLGMGVVSAFWPCVAQWSPMADTLQAGQQVALPRNPYLQTDGPLVFCIEQAFSLPDKATWFYLMLTLLLVLGGIRVVFWKYFTDLWQIFRQTTFRQKSIREQLLQNRTASLAMNVFFGLSAGAFLYQMAIYKQWVSNGLDWGVLGQYVLLVLLIYAVKFIGLKMSGWLFGVSEAAEAYIFLVFLQNKVVGILLLPATVLMAFGSSGAQSVAAIGVVLALALLYFYRYVVALPLARANTGGSSFHFFIYLCGMEIMPVLIVYKLALQTVRSA